MSCDQGSCAGRCDSRYIAIALGLIVSFLVFEVVMAFVGHLCARFGLDHTTLQVDHAPDELLTIGDGTS